MTPKQANARMEAHGRWVVYILLAIMTIGFITASQNKDPLEDDFGETRCGSYRWCQND